MTVGLSHDWTPGPLHGPDAGVFEIKRALWRLEQMLEVMQEELRQQLTLVKPTQAAASATISGGSVTLANLGGPSIRVLTVDTEGAASTDDLDTIGGTRATDIIIIRIANNSRSVQLTENGNLRLGRPIPTFLLDSTNDAATFVSDGTNLYALALRNN